jgi:hypothetical protein
MALCSCRLTVQAETHVFAKTRDNRGLAHTPFLADWVEVGQAGPASGHSVVKRPRLPQTLDVSWFVSES